MLLPQSSAFAALKNRLNSVSAIGYLHIAPRTYVPSLASSMYHSRQKSSESSASSSTPTASTSSFERPNRLKAREDGGIRWVELLEKFKNVQERARRARGFIGASLNGTDGTLEIRPKEKSTDTQPKPTAVPILPGNPPRNSVSPAPQPGHTKNRSSLSNLGRFAGNVAGRRAKK
jgi:vacuole morphology and inheritance protein 14